MSEGHDVSGRSFTPEELEQAKAQMAAEATAQQAAAMQSEPAPQTLPPQSSPAIWPPPNVDPATIPPGPPSNWYRPRNLVVGAVIALVILSAIFGESLGRSIAPKSHLASADVTMKSCTDGEFDVTTSLEIVNHSSKRSDYIIDIAFVSDANVKVGDGFAFENNVEPGQTALTDAIGTVSGNPSSFKCRIVSVTRTASN